MHSGSDLAKCPCSVNRKVTRYHLCKEEIFHCILTAHWGRVDFIILHYGIGMAEDCSLLCSLREGVDE